MENLSTQESLKIIQSIIDKRKQSYEENGFFLLFWGALVMLASIIQYVLIINGKGHISGYAWAFTMIPGFIFTIIYAIIKGKKQTKKNVSRDPLGFLWLVAGTCAMLTGFVFGKQIWGQTFILLIYMPFCIAALASALSIKNNVWVVLSVASIIVAYASLFVKFVHFPLFTALISLLLFTIPGVILFVNYKKRKNV